MRKLVQHVVFVSSFVMLMVLCSATVARIADAQINLKIGSKSISITPQTSEQNIKMAVAAIAKGDALLVLPRSSQGSSRNLKKAVTLKLGTQTIAFRAPQGRYQTLNVNSSNKKTQQISFDVIEALLIAAGIVTQEQQSSYPVPTNFATVYRTYTYTQCESNEQQIAAVDAELSRRKVTTFDSYCATASEPKTSAVCGGIAFGYRLHVIDRAQIIWAAIAGFYPLERLTTPLTRTECTIPAESQTIEMVGMIENIACLTTQNTVESFDRRLVDGGLNILGSSCGYSIFYSPSVCGQADIAYRSVRIYKSQRDLALKLGLEDKSTYQLFVRFGAECPVPVIYDPPLGWIEMVGVISNNECNPPVNTVGIFDQNLKDARIPVLTSSCGYLKVPTNQPCQDVYRAVTIPESQEFNAIVLLGLFRKSNVASTVQFGQACPK